MPDEKSHTEQGQIERAQRLRQVIEELKQGHGKSLKEQIEERAHAAERQSTSDSE